MLSFERRVVAALATRPDDGAVEAFVDGSLRAMPEVLRFGLWGESVALSLVDRLVPTQPAGDLGPRLTRWEDSRIGLLRSYVHAFRSLVLFAENELPTSAGSESSVSEAAV
jgi:hypothetical protein